VGNESLLPEKASLLSLWQGHGRGGTGWKLKKIKSEDLSENRNRKRNKSALWNRQRVLRNSLKKLTALPISYLLLIHPTQPAFSVL